MKKHFLIRETLEKLLYTPSKIKLSNSVKNLDLAKYMF